VDGEKETGLGQGVQSRIARGFPPLSVKCKKLSSSATSRVCPHTSLLPPSAFSFFPSTRYLPTRALGIRLFTFFISFLIPYRSQRQCLVSLPYGVSVAFLGTTSVLIRSQSSFSFSMTSRYRRFPTPGTGTTVFTRYFFLTNSVFGVLKFHLRFPPSHKSRCRPLVTECSGGLGHKTPKERTKSFLC